MRNTKYKLTKEQNKDSMKHRGSSHTNGRKAKREVETGGKKGRGRGPKKI